MYLLKISCTRIPLIYTQLTVSVPGKPLTNITAVATTSTSIRVSWACADCQRYSDMIGFYVAYELKSSEENETGFQRVNETVRNLTITGLNKFKNYSIWVQRATSWGLGLPSEPASVRTFEDGG